MLLVIICREASHVLYFDYVICVVWNVSIGIPNVFCLSINIQYCYLLDVLELFRLVFFFFYSSEIGIEEMIILLASL